MIRKETEEFYLLIKSKHEELTKELMEKDCQRVEFIRGVLSAYSEILKEKANWQPEITFTYFK